MDTRAIEEKTNSVGHLALPIAKRIHELFKSRGPLDLEEDFVVVIGHLDIQVLRWDLFAWVVASRAWGLFLLRHFERLLITGLDERRCREKVDV